MTGKVRHLLNRDGRFFARLVVPAELRAAIGKSEIRTALGPDRRTALVRLPRAVAALQDRIAEARRNGTSAKPPKGRSLSAVDLARLLYAEELSEDDRMRNEPPDEILGGVATHNAVFGKERLDELVHIANGEAQNSEIDDCIGWALHRCMDRGYAIGSYGDPEWRRTARLIATVQIEALKRSIERDRGEFGGTPTFPILNEASSSDRYAEAVPLLDLLDGYAAELKRSGRGIAAERRWRPCFAALVQFLKHDDARRLTRPDVVRWKEYLLDTLAAKTVRDVYLSGLKAVLTWAVDAGKGRVPGGGVAGREQAGREARFS